MFLLYSPLNQGLKHEKTRPEKNNIIKFLLYSPLNQGLKPYTLTSLLNEPNSFLLYSPLNQGLKHIYSINKNFRNIVFTLQSIKSRIETACGNCPATFLLQVFTLQSIKSRIETEWRQTAGFSPRSCFYSTVH